MVLFRNHIKSESFRISYVKHSQLLHSCHTEYQIGNISQFCYFSLQNFSYNINTLWKENKHPRTNPSRWHEMLTSCFDPDLLVVFDPLECQNLPYSKVQYPLRHHLCQTIPVKYYFNPRQVGNLKCILPHRVVLTYSQTR